MKIVFYPQSLLPVHAKSLEERPMGGTETGLIRLAEALDKRGHSVVVFTSEKNPPESKPAYYHLSKAQGLKAVDVFISIREWIPLVYPLPARKKFFWTGDSYDQVHNFGLGDKRLARVIDGVLTVSDWHADSLSEMSGLPREKCFTIRNGIHLESFQGEQERSPYRLIYAATPFRGLDHLVKMFPRIREQIPEATLEVFSGFEVYRGAKEYAPEIQARYKPLLDAVTQMPGATLHGNVTQKELAKELQKSSILAYPNTFQETSCILAMEAIAAGAIPVTTALAALPETVGDCGLLIDGIPGKDDYYDRFIDATVSLLKDSKRQQELRARGKARAAAEFSWDTVAERFEKYLEEKLA